MRHGVSGRWRAAARDLAAVVKPGAKKPGADSHGAGSPEARPANTHYRSARAAEQEDDWTAAVEAYRKALDQEPDRASWHYRLGRALEKTRDWPAAANAYQAAVDLEPGNAAWHYRLGRAFERFGHWLGAVSAYQAAVSRDWDRPDWYYRLGVSFLKLRNFECASYSFREADKRFHEGGDTTGDPPSSWLPYERRVELALVTKPMYAYCLFRGAQLAKRLGIEHVSALEFGVAGGNGLLAMEAHAAEIERITGVRISVYGFDSGEGLYEPADVRDMPYYFAPGHYRMDVEGLKSRLTDAQLILGDARTTFAEFVGANHSPIAAIAFDMDYYSSTIGVLEVAGKESSARSFLPRVYCYFDDVTGFKTQDYNEFTGELLAMSEFNGAHPSAKFARDRYFMARPFRPAWGHKLYTFHRFDHPDYGTYVGHTGPTSLKLRG